MTKLFPNTRAYIQSYFQKSYIFSWFQEPLKITTFFEYGSALSKATNNPVYLYAGMGLSAIGAVTFSTNSIANITGVVREKNQTVKAEMIEQLENTGEQLIYQSSYTSLKYLAGWSVAGLIAQAASEKTGFIGFSLGEQLAFSNAKIHKYNIFISAAIAGIYGATVNLMNMSEEEANSRTNGAYKAASFLGNAGLQASKYVAQKAYETASYIPKTLYTEVMKGDLHKASAKVVTFYEAGKLLSKAADHPTFYYSGKLMLATAIPGAIAIGVGSINKLAETIEALANSNQHTKGQIIKGIENTSVKLVSEVTDYLHNPLKHVDLLAPAVFALTLAAGKIIDLLAPVVFTLTFIKIESGNNAVSEISCAASKILAYNTVTTLVIAGSYWATAKIAETTFGDNAIKALDYIKDAAYHAYETTHEAAMHLIGADNN